MAHGLKRDPARAGEAGQEQPLAAEKRCSRAARPLNAVVYRVLETHHAARIGPEAFAFSQIELHEIPGGVDERHSRPGEPLQNEILTAQNVDSQPLAQRDRQLDRRRGWPEIRRAARSAPRPSPDPLSGSCPADHRQSRPLRVRRSGSSKSTRRPACGETLRPACRRFLGPASPSTTRRSRSCRPSCRPRRPPHRLRFRGRCAATPGCGLR